MPKHNRSALEKRERNLVYSLLYKQKKCKNCKHKSCRGNSCILCGHEMK